MSEKKLEQPRLNPQEVATETMKHRMMIIALAEEHLEAADSQISPDEVHQNAQLQFGRDSKHSDLQSTSRTNIEQIHNSLKEAA